MLYDMACKGLSSTHVQAYDVSSLPSLNRHILTCSQSAFASAQTCSSRLCVHRPWLCEFFHVLSLHLDSNRVLQVVMEILYLGVWCRPFSQYWAVPPSNVQCSAATNHLITNAVLNISSDLMIIAIPMPLLFKVKIPLKNKMILMGIFLIGAFNVSVPPLTGNENI